MRADAITSTAGGSLSPSFGSAAGTHSQFAPTPGSGLGRSTGADVVKPPQCLRDSVPVGGRLRLRFLPKLGQHAQPAVLAIFSNSRPISPGIEKPAGRPARVPFPGGGRPGGQVGGGFCCGSPSPASSFIFECR
jgi:hypothetical protein